VPGRSAASTGTFPAMQIASSSSRVQLTAFAAVWHVKIFWILVLTLWISIPYYWIERAAVFPPVTMPALFLDHAIPFVPFMVWPYLSLYPMLMIAPALLHHSASVRRFVVDFFCFSAISLAVFFFFPTRVERPDCVQIDPLYHQLVQIDAPLNACPSLHASMAVYSALWCVSLLRSTRFGLAGAIGVGLWTLAILYATLAIRQHVLLDLVAGTALALAAFFRPGVRHG